MDDLIASLKAYIILSLQDLSNIKETIAERYLHLSSVERAEILALAIHNHLSKHLKGVDDAFIDTLMHQILSETLAKHVYTISRHDVFQSIFQLDLNEETRVGLAETWLSESAQILVPRWALESYVKENVTFTSDKPALKSNPVPIVTSQRQFKLQDYVGALYTDLNHFMAKHVTAVAVVLFVISIVAFTSYIGHLPQIRKNTPSSFALEISQIQNFESLGKITLATENMDAFRYQTFDYFAVKNYILLQRNGSIGNAEHYNLVIQLARLNDIDPLLLFAIIGHEQAFVPMDAIHRERIIRNPYNVYHSWLEYNTNLVDSTQIAINTIKLRLDKKPLDVAAFEWLNMTYAEDPNWHVGVNAIYNHLINIGR